MLKDWSRDLMFPFDWTNQKSKDRLIAYPFEKIFVVEVLDKSEKILLQKPFDTRDLAVKFAMDYMKNH